MKFPVRQVGDVVNRKSNFSHKSRESSAKLQPNILKFVSSAVTVPFEFMEDYSKDATIHGVKYFSERKRHWSEKLFWLTIFTVSITFCVKNVMEIFEKRQTRPVMISFAKSLSPTFVIPFPAVTICPESKVPTKDFNISKALHENFQNLTSHDLKRLKALTQVCDFNDHINSTTQLISEENDVIATLEKMANPMLEMFSRCRYGSRHFCDCTDYFHKVITDEGICYTFNMLDRDELFTDLMDADIKFPVINETSDWFLDKEYDSVKVKVYPSRVIGSGLQSGLTVELKMKKSNLNPGCKRGMQGFRLSLHTPVEIPQMSKQFYSIPFQKQTTISIRPHMIYSSKDVEDYEPVSRQCFFNYEKKLRFFKTYSKSSCELECLSEQILSSCGCVKFSMPHHNSTQVCDQSKLECILEAETNHTTRDLERKLLSKQLKRELKHGIIKKDDEKFKKLDAMTLCNCLPSCTSLRYDAEISQSDFSIEDDEEFLTASINIYFKSAHFTRLKRYEIYGFSDFLSSTGGIFGLFLGCSVLSFVEIFYHLIAYCVRRIKNHKSVIITQECSNGTVVDTSRF